MIGLAIRHASVVALLGPRQSGKTTLARQFAASGGLPFDEGLAYFDLEDPRQIERLVNARLALEPLRGPVVVDEVQRRPDLFPLLRVLADREGTPARFLILGSASRDLKRPEIGKNLGVAHTTVARYLDILTGTLMVRALPPWLENIGKRQIKTPKIFFRDTGILHRLIDTPTTAQLAVHPRLGASWGGFAVEHIIRALGVHDEEAFF